MLVAQAIATWKICVKPVIESTTLQTDLEKQLRGILSLRENSSPVFLTGFMGVGKSTIGKELSKMTGRTFLDTDHLIEEEEGQSVHQIFQQKGEQEFRKLEKNAILKSAQSKNTIVSLGGGAIMDPDNLNHILTSGKLVLLSLDEETLVKRLSHTKNIRPLFAGMNSQEIKNKIHSLLSARASGYARAHFEISTRDHSPHETAQALISKIGEYDGN